MNSTTRRIWKRAGPPAALAAALALMLVPSASSQGGPPYGDPSGDNSSAPDVTGVTVQADKGSGQIIFRITGSNLSSASDLVTLLAIDSDTNPTTGNPDWSGADYLFGVDNESYGFVHWNGSDWVDSPDSTVRVCCVGGGSNLTISVNRSELANTSEFNFSVETKNMSTKAYDDAPDLGMYNYSLDAGGPDIQGVMVQTTPSSGPKAGKPFVVTPIGLKLPPDGAIISVLPQPESYSCKPTLKGRAVPGSGTGGCTLRIPKKKTRGKPLTVVVTVSYEGATKSVPFTFVVS
jgi:hypothetical protein